MAAPKAPLLDAGGKKSKDVTLEATVFGAEVKPHIVHETVRAELNAETAETIRQELFGAWLQDQTRKARVEVPLYECI